MAKISLMGMLDEKQKAALEANFNAREKAREEKEANKVAPEMAMLSEFGRFYGWAAITDVRKQRISIDFMVALLQGARKDYAIKLIDSARATQIAVASAMSDKPNKTFDAAMKPFLERAGY